jgi:hypothetical protein
MAEHLKFEASKTLKDSRGFDVQLKVEASFADAYKALSGAFKREEGTTRAAELARQRAEAEFRMKLYLQKMDEAVKYRHLYQSMSNALR